MSNKTKPSTQSVTQFIEEYPNASIRGDCLELVKFFTKITGFEAVLWGRMVGFGSYHYKYASGHSGDFFLAGFAPSKTGITIYTDCDTETSKGLLLNLGKHKSSKACIYIKKLSDIDLKVLDVIVINSIARVKKTYN